MFGVYANSEAEALKIGYGIRSGNNPADARWVFDDDTRWIDQVVINNETFDTTNYPHDIERAYIITHPEMAALVGETLGIENFREGDEIAAYELNYYLPQAVKETLREDFNGVSGRFMTVGAMRPFPRIFNLDPLPENQENYKNYLLQQVDLKIAELHIPRQAEYAHSFVRVAPDGGQESELFRHLLDAISTDNEVAFIHNLARFSDRWGSRHLGARNPFFEAFTTLFVAKRFPSRAIKGLYFHFALNCGQIHT